MKIGFVLDDSLDSTDGIQQYILALGREYVNRGHSVHYLVGETKRTDIPHVFSLSRNVKVRFNGNRMSMPLPAGRKKLRELLAREQYDVLHVQLPHSPFMAGHLVKLAPVSTRVFGTFHIAPNGRLAVLGSVLLALLLRSSLKRFDQVVSVSPAAQQFAQKYYGLTTTVLPNVVDVARFQPTKAVEKSTVPRIIFLGRLVPRKGCAILLQAVHKLQQRRPDLQFETVVAGRGPLLQELQAYATVHLPGSVTFAGYLDEADKPAFLQAADLAVFPSSGGESFGIVLIEAMASGAVVLAADNPGYYSVLADSPDQLFKVNDVDGMSTRLEQLLDDASQRQALQGWQNAAVGQYDTALVATKLLGMYRQP